MKSNVKCFMVLLSFFSACSTMLANRQEEESQPETQAQLLSFEDMTYPGVARVARVQGIVVLKARIDQAGTVTAASILLGPKALAQDSLANIKKWRFEPNSGKVAIIVYEFRLDDGACRDASHTLFRLVFPNFATITACNPVIQ